MDRDLELIATALDDSAEDDRRTEVLRELLRRDPEGRLARRHRASPALALCASELGLSDDVPARRAWRQRLRAVSAQQMHLEAAMSQMAADLGEIPWVPIKGMDLSRRVYDPPEERPTSDLDILVSRSRFEEARSALLVAGWTPLYEGPRAESYLQEEGYAWQARSSAGALVELHFRLWGLVDEAVAEAMVDASQDDPSLPGSGRRLRPAHAFIVAAVHLWLDPAPRAAGNFRDLERLARLQNPDNDDLAAEVVGQADRLDLQLPVLAAATVTHRLWNEPVCGAVAFRLSDTLRAPERLWWRRQRDPASASLSGLVLCRHLARRRSRHGLGLSLWRRLWPHPGIVANGSDARWSWPVRRLWYQLLTFRLKGPAARLADLFSRRSKRRNSADEGAANP